MFLGILLTNMGALAQRLWTSCSWNAFLNQSNGLFANEAEQKLVFSTLHDGCVRVSQDVPVKPLGESAFPAFHSYPKACRRQVLPDPCQTLGNTTQGLSSDQPRDAAPPFNDTSAQVFLKLCIVLTATSLALGVLTNRRSRALKVFLFAARRPAVKSARSIALICRRIQDQYFSTGFRSGEVAGILQRTTLQRLCAALLSGARRKLSLSQRILQGPRVLPGLAACKAFTSSDQLSRSFLPGILPPMGVWVGE